MTVTSAIEKSFNEYVKEIEKINKKLFSIIVSHISDFVVDGKFDTSLSNVAKIKTFLIDALKKSGYVKATNEYMKLVDTIKEINTKWYDKESINISKSFDNLLVKNSENAINNVLRGDELIRNIVEPLNKSLTSGLILKSDFKETYRNLDNIFNDKRIIPSYIENVAYDVMLEHDGTINNVVKVEHKLKYMYWIGSEIESTRPICSHIKDKYGSKAISEDQMQLVLDEFCPNGIPSKKSITYTTVNGKTFTREKGSGMKQGTNIKNISEKRGGYKCRHEVKYTRRPDL
jgi:hypothetical protein